MTSEILGADKPVLSLTKRVLVQTSNNTIYAMVKDPKGGKWKLRFSTYQGASGIAEYVNYEWVLLVGTERAFTKFAFRKWVVAYLDSEQEGAVADVVGNEDGSTSNAA